MYIFQAAVDLQKLRILCNVIYLEVYIFSISDLSKQWRYFIIVADNRRIWEVPIYT